MARLHWTGAETGHADELGLTVISGSNVSVAVVASNPAPRSGVYCYKAIAGQASGAVAYKRYALASAVTEILHRIAYAFTPYDPTDVLTVYRNVDSADGVQLSITWKPSDGLLRAYRGTSGGTLLGTSTTQLAANTWCLVQIRHLVHNSTGVVEVWVNGNKEIDFSGDTQNTANENLAKYDVGVVQHTATSGASWVAWDDLGTNDTGGATQNTLPADGAVLLLKPSGNGNSSQLDGSDGNQVDNYALVDEVPPSTTDYVYSDTQDEQDTYVLEDVPSPYNAVRLVQPIAYAALAAAGTGALRMVLRSGGTDYADAADQSLGTTYAFVQGDLRYVDPADSNAWTPAKVNALECGPRVR